MAHRGGPVNRPSRPVLALDIGGTKTIVAAVDGLPVDGLRPLRPPVHFATPRPPEAFLDALEAAAVRALPAGLRPAAIGIGVPGPLDAAAGVVEYSTNLGWRHLPLLALVRERFGGVPTVIEDDANSGALGEAIVGAGRGRDPFVYLPLGTGLGSGVIVGGRIVAGAHGAAGEVGHMAVHDRLGPRCNCGRDNCVEAWCSGIGLARRARETWPARTLPDGGPSPRDAAAVFALARRGDPAAMALVMRAQHAFAIGIAALLASVDPAVVAIGGSVGLAEPAFAREAFREATRLVHWSGGRLVRLRRPRLKGRSVLAGAAVLGARLLDGDASSDGRPTSTAGTA
jgi:glucokinase